MLYYIFETDEQNSTKNDTVIFECPTNVIKNCQTDCIILTPSRRASRIHGGVKCTWNPYLSSIFLKQEFCD